jgi:hypothetical protein
MTNTAAALDELAGLGCRVFGLNGEPITREVILRKSIARIVAKRSGQSGTTIQSR